MILLNPIMFTGCIRRFVRGPIRRTYILVYQHPLVHVDNDNTRVELENRIGCLRKNIMEIINPMKISFSQPKVVALTYPVCDRDLVNYCEYSHTLQIQYTAFARPFMIIDRKFSQRLVNQLLYSIEQVLRIIPISNEEIIDLHTSLIKASILSLSSCVVHNETLEKLSVTTTSDNVIYKIDSDDIAIKTEIRSLVI